MQIWRGVKLALARLEILEQSRIPMDRNGLSK